MTTTERHIHTQEIIRRLKEVDVGQTVVYNELSAIIGVDIRPQKPGYRYQYSARQILERDENMVFEVVPKVGLKRLSLNEVAAGSGPAYLEKKRSLINRCRRRITTVNDEYDNLSPEEKIQVTMHRTILAFDSEMVDTKRVLKIESRVRESVREINFNDTLKLFDPKLASEAV